MKEGAFPTKENEIVVSQGILDNLGIQAGIGDTVKLPYQIEETDELGYTKEKEFVISGLVADSTAQNEQKRYTAFVSQEFLQAEIPEDQILSYFVFRMNMGANATTDDIEENINGVAAQFDLTEDQIGINEDYLMVNYVDPTIVPVIVGIMIIIVFAGIITIYSIYYVNMPERVQEFGRLKAIGATRHQIRKIVFVEGLGVTAIALPIGLLLGTVLTRVIFGGLIGMYENENAVITLMKQLLEQHELSLYQWWIYLLTIVVTIFTVYISLRKPMKVASRISEMEALRYGQGNEKQVNKVTRKCKSSSSRKSYPEINIGKLSRIYLLGNKKNSAITIVSMGITGVFLMVIATVLSCANPRESATSDVHGQYRISVQTEDGNKEHPERAWKEVIKNQNNPLDDTLKTQIENLDGVKSVDVFKRARVLSDTLVDEGAGIDGVPETCAKELIDGIVEGHVTYDELKSGKKIILDKNMLRWNPELSVGSTLELMVDNDEAKKFTVEIAAIGEYPIGFSGYNYLMMADSAVEELTDGNLNDFYCIMADKDYDQALEKDLQGLIAGNELLEMRTWQQEMEQWQSAMAVTRGGCFIAERRKELNVSQKQLAEHIGVTDKTVSKWETGMRMPDATILLDLCQVLHNSKQLYWNWCIVAYKVKMHLQ